MGRIYKVVRRRGLMVGKIYREVGDQSMMGRNREMMIAGRG